MGRDRRLGGGARGQGDRAGPRIGRQQVALRGDGLLEVDVLGHVGVVADPDVEGQLAAGVGGAGGEQGGLVRGVQLERGAGKQRLVVRAVLLGDVQARPVGGDLRSIAGGAVDADRRRVVELTESDDLGVDDRGDGGAVLIAASSCVQLDESSIGERDGLVVSRDIVVGCDQRGATDGDRAPRRELETSREGVLNRERGLRQRGLRHGHADRERHDRAEHHISGLVRGADGLGRGDGSEFVLRVHVDVVVPAAFAGHRDGDEER